MHFNDVFMLIGLYMVAKYIFCWKGVNLIGPTKVPENKRLHGITRNNMERLHGKTAWNDAEQHGIFLFILK